MRLTHTEPRRDRRWFLHMAGGSAALACWLKQGLRRAEGTPAPLRLVVISRPNGTIDEHWLPNGRRGSILAPFESVWSHAVALKGADVKVDVVADGDPHSKGSITIMTGAPRNTKRIPGNDNHWNTAPSFDQVLAAKSPILSATRTKSLALGAWSFGPGGDAPSRALSFSGPEQPLYPEVRPIETYKRVFVEAMLPAGGAGGSDEALQRLRNSRRSVLDYVKGDLTRVRGALPSDQRTAIDAHEAALRDLEKALDEVPIGPAPGSCTAPAMPPVIPPEAASTDAGALAKIGQAHFALIRAAFVCDLTRIVTFMWTGNAAQNVFGSVSASDHHRLSHGNKRAELATIDRWYAEQTAPFIRSLVETTDPATGGKLIDGTLVWYLSEVAEGWNHRLTDMPFLLFGGDRVGLKARGRVHDVKGQHTANDVWLTVAPRFGVTLPPPPTPHNGPIAGLLT